MALSLVLPDGYTFDEYIVGANARVIAQLRRESTAWLYGDQSVGKTHLLRALCDSLENSIYIDCPGADLSGCETFDLIAVDNIESFVGEYETELELQMLYQSLDFDRNRLVTASQLHPHTVRFALKDLASRFRAFQTLYLEPLPADEKARFLIQCAKRRGIEVPENVAEYTVDRAERSQSALIAFLDKLDQTSLEQSRRVTIPFVRSLLQDE